MPVKYNPRSVNNKLLLSPQGHVKSLLEENFKPQMEFVLRDPILFGDYKNALDESEPRLYEDIQDYEAAKALFQEVQFYSLSIIAD